MTSYYERRPSDYNNFGFTKGESYSSLYILDQTKSHCMLMAFWVFIICLIHSMWKIIDHLLSDILMKYQTDSFFTKQNLLICFLIGDGLSTQGEYNIYSISHKICTLFYMLAGYSCIITPSADSRLAPNQWETSLQCNAVSHWLGASLESALTSSENLCDSFIPVLAMGHLRNAGCCWSIM